MEQQLERIANFLKHNNFVPISLMVIFLGANATLAASPEVRDQVYRSDEVARSVDNNFIVAVNLDSFDFDLVIGEILESDDQYFVTYSYNTIAIDDYVWKIVQKVETLNVSKHTLETSYIKDLGSYVAKTLGDNLEAERIYLGRVQEIQRTNGLTPKVLATEYSGLIGDLLDDREKTFPGYDPIYSESLPDTVREKMSPSMIASLTKEALLERRKIEKEEDEARLIAAAAEALKNATTTDDGTGNTDTTDIPDDTDMPTDTGTTTPPVSTTTPPIDPPVDEPPVEEPVPEVIPPAEPPPVEETEPTVPPEESPAEPPA